MIYYIKTHTNVFILLTVMGGERVVTSQLDSGEQRETLEGK